MKNTVNKLIIGFGLIIFALSSCDQPLGLGDRLDLSGPEIEFTAPAARKSVKAEFDIEGTAKDGQGIKLLLITVQLNRDPYPKQWKWEENKWWILEGFEAEDSWVEFALHNDAIGKYLTPVWTDTGEGNTADVKWKLPVNLVLTVDVNDKYQANMRPPDGEYLFVIQAWDANNNTDYKSLKTRSFIVDNDPPKVEIINPALFVSTTANPYTEWDIHKMKENEWQNISNVGKFQTNSFRMQWIISENQDIWSFDLRFYPHDTEIDSNPETPLPDNYIYRYIKNSGTRPPEENPDDYYDMLQKPNGSVIIPNLAADPSGSVLTEQYHQTRLTTKTTLKVVAVCYDGSGNPSEERTLGYFVYWPEADLPWIQYMGGMLPKASYNASTYEDAFTIFPGRTIKANAYHLHNLEKVTYSLFEMNPATGLVSSTPVSYTKEGTTTTYNNLTLTNEIRNGNYPTNFTWEFEPPGRSGYFVLEARAFSHETERGSPVYEALFRVLDTSYPRFPHDPVPNADRSLFESIGKSPGGTTTEPYDHSVFNTPTVPAGTIRIAGFVDDATEIEKLYLVWINPSSRNSAISGQLRYFREQDYIGWQVLEKSIRGDTEGNVINTGTGGSVWGGATAAGNGTGANPLANSQLEGFYDPSAPNRVWNIALTPAGTDEDGRNIYSYYQDIRLSDLGIPATRDLKSQTFLLRAVNSAPRITIITYAPLGDELSPTITVTDVVTTQNNRTETKTLYPGSFNIVDSFENRTSNHDTIQINGTWQEDSTGYIDFATYLRNNFEVSLNGRPLTLGAANFTTTKGGTVQTTGNATSGFWSVTVTVRGDTTGDNIMNADDIKDTLIVDASLFDIGGGKDEHSPSWLMRSDKLRLLRISSVNADTSYKAGDEIDIFFEFSKPVFLTNNTSNPTLTLNIQGGGTAVYKYEIEEEYDGTTTKHIQAERQASRHYFTYTVGSGHNITAEQDRLDVTGLNTAIAWAAANYPFTWHTGTEGTDSYEQIRITNNSAHDGEKPTGYNFYARYLPLYTTAADRMFTLREGKNIGIDTQAPTITSITPSTPAGHYRSGPVYIDVKFSEPVKVPALLAEAMQLVLNVTKSSGGTPVTTGSPRVNGDTVTFTYNIAAGDTTNGQPIRVIGATGGLTDLAGTNFDMSSISDMSEAAKTLTGRFIDTLKPGIPTVRVLREDNVSSVLVNTVNTSSIEAVSTIGVVDLFNVYNDNLWLAIEGNQDEATGGGSHEYNIGTIEYSINGTSYTSFDNITNTPFELTQKGTYTLRARQIDRAGNMSDPSEAITFNWDPGDIVKRIVSTSGNGTYTRNAVRSDKITVRVEFRKPVTLVGIQSITLNSSTTPITIFTAGSDYIDFTYNVGENDNTPATEGRDQYLDVTSMNIAARDSQGVLLNNGSGSNYVNLPKDTEGLLKNTQEILVQTGELEIESGPVFATTNDPAQDDEWTGTITFTFNRSIREGTGNFTMTQRTTDYRLPAVLTDTTKYGNARYFNEFYTRGTNGFVRGTTADDDASDTSTKYVLKYAESTVVTPNNTGNTIEQMAYDFHQAERVLLPVSSQDVVIDGNTLTIHVRRTNALQVLGAVYDYSIPVDFVQDGLSFGWPEKTDEYPDGYKDTYANPHINRPFVRIDKRVNEDRLIVQTGNATTPTLLADFSRVLQTTVRLDCRTPNSIVRYQSDQTEHVGGGVTTNLPLGNGNSWRNAGDADTTGTVARFNLGTTGGTNYTNFTGTGINAAGPHIQIGTTNYQGFVYRIAVRSRSGTGETTVDSTQYEEIAYRTVLTYNIINITPGTLGTGPQSGEQIWIRGGDSRGGSDVPGFPIRWQDNYNILNTEKRRAGIRLLELVSATGTTFYGNSGSVWRWVTWEINVRTYYDIFRGSNTAQSNIDAWQYGPRQDSVNRGGWVTQKDAYTLYPGRHRVVTMNGGGNYTPGGSVNFSNEMIPRPTPATSMTYPTP